MKEAELKKEAGEYAERVCNGEFPITYSRDQVVSHTSNDFLAGANHFRGHVISVLIENYTASKNLTDEDKIRTAQDTVNETYQDLIFILSGGQITLSQ